jgi:hypothetical protein
MTSIEPERIATRRNNFTPETRSRRPSNYNLYRANTQNNLNNNQSPLIHNELEDKIQSDFVSSVDYSIKNVKGYKGSELFTSFFNQYHKNGFWNRLKKFTREDLYVVDCNWQDKFATICIFISGIISLVILFRSFELNAHQSYVFNDPKDATNPEKQAKLDYYNEWSSGIIMILAKAFVIGSPAIMTFWCIFKRTSVHKNSPDN